MTKFRSKNCLGFLEHWKSLRNGSDATLRQSVFLDKPNPLYAPYLYIVEIGDSDLIVRLMGTKLVERWGRDKTGESLGAGQPPNIQKAFFENARLAAPVPSGFRIVVEFAASNGSQMLVEAAALPLEVKAGRPVRMVAFSEILDTLKYGELTETLH